MALRFKHRIKILPGVHLNFSARGLSLSVGPRGASVTLGNRGTYANLGIPGSGLSYRTRLSVPQAKKDRRGTEDQVFAIPSFDQSAPPDVSPEPDYAYEQLLEGLLRGREKGVVDWHDRAHWLEVPPPPESDEEAFDNYVFRFATARFAKRMVEGDRAAWSEVVRTELINEQLPFEFAFNWGIDESTGIIYVEIELPKVDVVPIARLSSTKRKALYEDVGCALLLRFAHEIFRVIPDATDIHLSGYRPTMDPATGHPAHSVYLRWMINRAKFSKVDLDYVDPSSAFEWLGGSKRTKRGELVPIAIEPGEQLANHRAATESEMK
jgi:hypothetical protein